METKLKNLAYYVKLGIPLFPCGADKKPLTPHGFHDATLDFNTIKAWHEKFPEAAWAIPTGPKSENGAGIVVIDIDQDEEKKIDGFRTWEQLRDEHSEPIETVTVITGRGGNHLWFAYPEGHDIRCGTNVLGPGIDIRARGGYVIVPPSRNEKGPYKFEFSPVEVPIMELPSWLLSRLNGRITKTQDTEPKVETPGTEHNRSPKKNAADLTVAISALNALKKERADNYQQWLEVGMSLFSLGDDGLIAWDQWSKQSEKYEKGACAQKWKSFSKELTDANKISFGSLIHWAEEDDMQPFIRQAARGASPEDYARTLTAFGYTFSQNDMNDMIYVNDIRMSDVLTSVIEFNMRNYGYRSEKDTQIAISKMAHDHLFHPIRDYLTGLIWEGHFDGERMIGVDHISRLCTYFKDKDDVFPILLRKWLIGAVGRILGSRPGQQQPMLVLDGPQGIGKSRFTWWLGSPLPAFYIQSSINTSDKDFLILLCSKFVWEVEELGATLRKSDIESLKAFLSKEIVNVRKPYGRDEITKPATASFIGTINNSGGFLADPTGSRRFRVCTLETVNWAYADEVDVNQIWAQAVALFEGGERWELDSEKQKLMAEINARYDVDDPIHFDLIETFHIEPLELDRHTATAQIIHKLRADGKVVGGSDQQIAQRIANVLVKLGCEKANIRVNGQMTRVWRGVWERKFLPPDR